MPDLWTFSSLVVGIAGIGFAIFFYLKSKRLKRLHYRVSSFRVVSKEAEIFPNLQIRYKDIIQENVVATKVIIWNSGNELIEPSDFAKDSSLQISAAKILEVNIISPHNNVNNFSLENSGEKCKVSWEYLSPNEGLVVAILHTEANQNKLSISGKIKGGHIFEKENDLIAQELIKGLISLTSGAILSSALYVPKLGILDTPISRVFLCLMLILITIICLKKIRPKLSQMGNPLIEKAFLGE